MYKNPITIEEAILNILLNFPEMIFKMRLEPRWFSSYRNIIDIMLKLAADGATIDAFSVSDALGGDLALVVTLQKDSFGAVSNYRRYLHELQRLYEEREIKTLIAKSYHALGAERTGTEVLSTLIAESIAIAGLSGTRSTYNAKQALAVFVDKLEETYAARDTGGLGLKTGIAALDASLGGLHPSDLTIVGARPGVGKTAWAVSVMRTIAKTGKRVGFFSTEMSVFQVMSRFTAIEANIDAHKLRQADLDEFEFARITAATAAILGLDLRICDKPAITIGELTMQARAWAADGGLDVLVVDYLTRLHPDKAGTNQNLEVGLIVTGLKNLARHLNIPVIVLAQLNRQPATRKDKMPVASDLRDSGIIEQEADQILLLYRPEVEDGGGPVIIIEKNRHGATGTIRCEFEPKTMCWRDSGFSYE
jgi:replicative DNA helicase